MARPQVDVQLVLLAGPKEVWSTVRIHEGSGRLVPVVGADLDLADLAGLLGRLDLLVTYDSGPMHLAAALGVRCVAIFGPTDPRRTSPFGDVSWPTAVVRRVPAVGGPVRENRCVTSFHTAATFCGLPPATGSA